MAVLAVEVHVEPGVAQGPGLALLDGLAPDEVLDVGVVGVEDDHLGRPAGLAPRLDRAGRGVGAPHEADRARGGAAARRPSFEERIVERLTPAPDPPLKMIALLGVPVEDRVHRVVDREDEAGRGLLGHSGDADVEPHRRVERRLLVDDQVLELVAEGLGLVVVDEVAVLAAPAR